MIQATRNDDLAADAAHCHCSTATSDTVTTVAAAYYYVASHYYLMHLDALNPEATWYYETVAFSPALHRAAKNATRCSLDASETASCHVRLGYVRV